LLYCRGDPEKSPTEHSQTLRLAKEFYGSDFLEKKNLAIFGET
jgi:hypothetical protein